MSIFGNPLKKHEQPDVERVKKTKSLVDSIIRTYSEFYNDYLELYRESIKDVGLESTEHTKLKELIREFNLLENQFNIFINIVEAKYGSVGNPIHEFTKFLKSDDKLKTQIITFIRIFRNRITLTIHFEEEIKNQINYFNNGENVIVKHELNEIAKKIEKGEDIKDRKRFKKYLSERCNHYHLPILQKERKKWDEKIKNIRITRLMVKQSIKYSKNMFELIERMKENKSLHKQHFVPLSAERLNSAFDNLANRIASFTERLEEFRKLDYFDKLESLKIDRVESKTYSKLIELIRSLKTL